MRDMRFLLIPLRFPVVQNPVVSRLIDLHFAKKIDLSELPLQKRAGKGIICYKPNDSTGIITSAVLVSDEDALLVMGNKNSICISAKDIPELGRPSMGNLIIKDEKVNMVSKI